MKVRITVLTENDKPLPPVDEKRPTEEQIVKAWQFIFDMMTIMGKSNEKVTVESAEFIEEAQE